MILDVFTFEGGRPVLVVAWDALDTPPTRRQQRRLIRDGRRLLRTLTGEDAVAFFDYDVNALRDRLIVRPLSLGGVPRGAWKRLPPRRRHAEIFSV